MARLLKINGGLDHKIKMLSSILFEPCSPSEIKLMSAIINQYNDMGLIITGQQAKYLRTSSGLNGNTFNVVLSRLYKKRLIIKVNSVTTLNPVFKGIDQEQEFVLRFLAVTG